MLPLIIGGALGLAGGITSALSNKSINESNIKMQRETNAQNERLLRESWGREDNAVQRRASDLEAAGISPLMAAGSAAASSAPTRMESPKAQPFMPDLAAALISGVSQGLAMNKTVADIEAQKQQLALAQGDQALYKRQVQAQEMDVLTRQAAEARSGKEQDALLNHQQALLRIQEYEKILGMLRDDYNLQLSASQALRTTDTGNDYIKAVKQVTRDASSRVNPVLDVIRKNVANIADWANKSSSK